MGVVRLGVVGCGFISGIHQQAFEKLKGKMEITGCCDLIIERAQAMADAVGCDFVCTDYKDLFDRVDAVLLAVPHEEHYPMGSDFIRHGKHVMMEKPMAVTEQECLDLIKLAKEYNVKFMVAYIMRYHPMCQELKKIVDDKRYGEIFQMSIWTEQFTRQPDYDYSAHALGGGQFFSHGCHYVDLLLWYLGNPVKAAHIGSRRCTPWIEWEGTSNAIFEFEGGKLAYHFGTWGTIGTRHSYAIHAFFENGMVECCLNEGKMYLHKTSNLSNYFEKSDIEEVIFECEPTGHLPWYELDHFAECIINDTEPLTSGETSLQGLRVIWRMYGAESQDKVADLRGISLNGDWDFQDGPGEPWSVPLLKKMRGESD